MTLIPMGRAIEEAVHPNALERFAMCSKRIEVLRLRRIRLQCSDTALSRLIEAEEERMEQLRQEWKNCEVPADENDHELGYILKRQRVIELKMKKSEVQQEHREVFQRWCKWRERYELAIEEIRSCLSDEHQLATGSPFRSDQFNGWFPHGSNDSSADDWEDDHANFLYLNTALFMMDRPTPSEEN